jgi:hypothetical protein
MTHKDCSALRLENEVAISPANLLELRFLFIIMKEEKVIAIVLNSINMKVSFSFGSNDQKTGHKGFLLLSL